MFIFNTYYWYFTWSLRSFEMEMSKNFVGNKSKNYMSLSLLLDMFGKTTPEAKILGTYKFVKHIAKELNTDITISLGKKHKDLRATVKTRIRLQPIDPNSPQKLLWDMFISMLTLYAVASTIAFIALENPVSDAILYLDAVVDVLFIVDIMLNFVTAFVRNN